MIRKFHYKDKNVSVSWVRNEKQDAQEHSMHTHETAEILYFISGKAVFYVEGNEYSLEKGDILFTRPAESHFIELDKSYPYERVVINFNTEMFTDIDPDRVLLKALFERKAGKLNLFKGYRFKDDIHKLCIKNMMDENENKRINITSNLLLLLNEVSKVFSDTSAEQEQESNDSIEYKIIRYVKKHIKEELTLDRVCEEFYISKPQLCRIFKRSVGTTMGQYITIKRLVMARKLMSEGSKPTAVYSECGFRDYSTFYRAYIKNFGEAPSEMRSK